MPNANNWQELRDERGKLCARIDQRRMLLEIRRSDRLAVAVFDLRQYFAECLENPLEIENDLE